MIQDAHPVRSGVPDGYRALFRVDVITAGASWILNLDRLPSGFDEDGALSGVLGQATARNAAGQGGLIFPAGMRVRGVNAGYSPPSSADASQRTVHVATINETLGRLTFTLKDDTGAIADPIAPTSATSFDSTIWIELTLETV